MMGKQNITFVINPAKKDGDNYKTGTDKDGLTRANRKRIEEIKEEMHNPINPYAKEVWDE